MGSLEKEFKNPSAALRGAPFWSWNGKLSKAELERQIDNLKAMGMGGYFCHSRTGLITEYLGEEWFELINACAEKGKQEGMEVWLYDEDRWPSGTAGGIVTEIPEYRLNYIRLSIITDDNFAFTPNTVAAFAVELEGLAFKSKWRIFNANEAKGNTILHFTREEMAKDSFYNGNTYVDTMNKEAIEYYMQLTHKKYEEKSGQYFGETIKGIFTDEPHRGAVMCGFSLSNPDAGYLTPYPKNLFEEFSKAYGYDLIDYLPELFLQENGEKVHRVKWQYMELLQTLFIDHFFKPLYHWSEDNGIKLTGHVLHEDSLTCQACMIGSVMRAYEYMQAPGVDVLGEHNYQYWIVKQLQSAARQLGKKQLLSELYGCTGWQMGFEGHKAIGDWQALFGINLRCHHLSWYTMLGEAKRDYPASISHQSAWYEDYHYIEDYYSRIHALMNRGEPVCKLLIINPVESVWAIIYPNWSKSLATADETAAQLEAVYRKTFQTLCGAKIDFDYGDEDFIKRFAKVEIINGKTMLTVGQASYETVLITGMLTIRSTTLAVLTEFAKMGGKIVFAGDAPAYVDALRSEQAYMLLASHAQTEQLPAVLGMPEIKATDKNGNNISDIYAQVRRDGDDLIVMLLNINRKESYLDVQISMDAEGYIEQWDARSGDIYLLGEGKPEFSWDFEPSGELLLVITKKNNNRSVRQNKQVQKSMSAGDTFAYRLHEPNVCVLDYIDYQIDGGPWTEHMEVLKADRQIRSALNVPHRGGQMVQPWFAGKQKQEVLCDLAIRYCFDIAQMPAELTLAIETPEEFEIRINGQKATEETDGYWVDVCFKLLKIDTSALVKGKNEITLTMPFRKDINLENIFLLGAFGVQTKGAHATLTTLPEKLQLGDITRQGLPFYGAGLSYYIDLPKLEAQQALSLSTENFSAACLKVKNDTQEVIIYTRPYSADISQMAGGRVELQYILTRNNTFGPIHMPPKEVYWYGPASYLTEGENWQEEYQLYPQGMTKEVFINITK